CVSRERGPLLLAGHKRASLVSTHPPAPPTSGCGGENRVCGDVALTVLDTLQRSYTIVSDPPDELHQSGRRRALTTKSCHPFASSRCSSSPATTRLSGTFKEPAVISALSLISATPTMFIFPDA